MAFLALRSPKIACPISRRKSEWSIVDDALNENDETIEIRQSSAGGMTQASSQAVTIAADDLLPELSLAVGRTSPDEGSWIVAMATLNSASGR